MKICAVASRAEIPGPLSHRVVSSRRLFDFDPLFYSAWIFQSPTETIKPKTDAERTNTKCDWNRRIEQDFIKREAAVEKPLDCYRCSCCDHNNSAAATKYRDGTSKDHENCGEEFTRSHYACPKTKCPRLNRGHLYSLSQNSYSRISLCVRSFRSWRSCASRERVAIGRASRRATEMGSPVSSQ